MNSITDDLQRALRIINSSNMIRVISHQDADGLASGGMLCKVLRELNKDFHISITKDLTNFTKIVDNISNYDLLLLSDLGSNQVDKVKELGIKTIIMDHHKPLIRSAPNADILEINVHDYGWDGMNEGCASSLVYALASKAVPLQEMIIYMLAGAIGDRQNLDAGLNGELVQASKRVHKKFGVNLDSRDRSDWIKAVESSITPYFKGISGRKGMAEQILKGCSDEKEIATRLSISLLKQGASYESINELLGYDYTIPNFNYSARELTQLLNSSQNMPDLALSCCLRDDFELVKRELLDSYYTSILSAMNNIEDGKAVKEKKNVQYFFTADLGLKNKQGGEVCGLAMKYILNQSKVSLAISEHEDDYRISARATDHLLSEGIDLNSALNISAKAVGGTGGGHPIAAGASIPKAAFEKFLEHLDTQLERCRKRALN